MYEPMPAPPPKRGRPKRIVLIVLFAVLGLCAVGGAAGGLVLYKTVGKEVPAVRSAAASYLDALQAGDAGAAYGKLCDSVRSRLSRDAFAAQTSALRSYNITDVQVNNDNGTVTGAVSAHLTLPDGSATDRTFAVVKEHGTWTVCDGQ